MNLPPMMVKMVLDKLREGYDAEQVTAGVAQLCHDYPDDVPTIRQLLTDVLAALPAPAAAEAFAPV